jgi:hypothetical protein
MRGKVFRTIHHRLGAAEFIHDFTSDERKAFRGGGDDEDVLEIEDDQPPNVTGFYGPNGRWVPGEKWWERRQRISEERVRGEQILRDVKASLERKQISQSWHRKVISGLEFLGGIRLQDVETIEQAATDLGVIGR